MKKYRFFDFLFLLLPAVAVIVVLVNLDTGSSDSGKWDFGISGVIFLILGAIMIAFYRSFAKLGAWWHSYWHPVYYRKKDEPEDENSDGGIYESSEAEEYVPTKTNYGLTFASGVIVYGMGLAAAIIQIASLKG